jgi:hypothetical protein
MNNIFFLSTIKFLFNLFISFNLNKKTKGK